MTTADYVKGLSFRYTQPDQPSHKDYWIANSKDEWLDKELENIELPLDNVEMKRRLRPLGFMPRMCTYANAAIINYGVSQLPEGQCYVNVGVWHGFSFLAGIVGNPDKLCIGVDDFSQLGGPQAEFMERFEGVRTKYHEFFLGDYVAYFSRVHSAPIGFYFYDGNHSYADQINGLRLAEPYFADGCIVMVDDTNFDAPYQATMDFLETTKNSYQILLDQKVYEEAGHPTFWNGLLILQKGGTA